MTDAATLSFPDPALCAVVLSEDAGSTLALWNLDDAGLAAAAWPSSTSSGRSTPARPTGS